MASYYVLQRSIVSFQNISERPVLEIIWNRWRDLLWGTVLLYCCRSSLRVRGVYAQWVIYYYASRKLMCKQNNNTNPSNDKVSTAAMAKIPTSSLHIDMSSNCSVLLGDLCPCTQSCRVLLNTWSPHEQLGQKFDWLSGRTHRLYCMSFHWCSILTWMI